MLLIMVAVSLVGIASLPYLNIRYKPERPQQNITVAFRMPGAVSQVVEAEVTSKLEGVLNSVAKCSGISSVSYKGGGSITLEFDKNADMAAARFEVASAIRNIYDKLPSGVTYPTISLGSDGSRSSTSIVYYVKSSLPSQEIEKFIEGHVLTPVSSLKGIDDVQISGTTFYEWEIVFDADKAASLGITASDISSSFSSYYAESAAGITDTPSGTLAVRLSGSGAPRDFGDIPVKKSGEMIVHLADIAEWHYREALAESDFRVNGLNTVILGISTSSGANLISTVKNVRRTMQRLQESFPDEITASVAWDSSDYVREELGRIYFRTGLCILILLLFVFAVSRSWRYMFITVVTMAVNLLCALAIYSFAGIPVHIYTLAGITVSLGIVIDTSIVMIDHYRHFGDRRVFPSLVSAVGTTVAAILLVNLLPAEERLNLTDFIWVIVINLTLSLVISYLFIPALMDTFPIREKEGKNPIRRKRRIVRHNRFYIKYITWGVRHRWVYLLLIVAGFAYPFKRFADSLDRSNFYREPTRNTLTIAAGMLEGCTVQQLNEVVKEMENYLASFDGIESFRTEIRAYNDAVITVEFKPEYENTSFPSRLKMLVTGMAINFGGANWKVYGVDESFFNNTVVSSRRSHKIALYGYNFQELMRYAEIAGEMLSEQRRVSGTEISGSEYGFPSMEFNLDYDFGSMVASGIDPYRYYGEMASLLYNNEIGRIPYNGRLTPVKLRSSDSDQFDLWHIVNTPIQVDSLKMTLGSVGSIAKKPSGINIHKDNQSYRLYVQFDFIGSYELSRKVVGEIVDRLNDEVLPTGYKAEVPEYGWFDENRDRYAWLVVLIIAVIYAMLSVSFESLRLPFAIILMIPVSFIGVFIKFGFGKLAFDQGGFAAFVMLCGIVVNAGIYLIHSFMGIKGGNSAAGLDARVRSYVKAFGRKVTPIFLTVVSTVLGLLPFLSDGPTEVFWYDFAVGTIAGMAFSVIAIYFFLPVFAVRRAD